MSTKAFEKLSAMTAPTALSPTVYVPEKYYPESLANGAIGTGTSWTVTGDFAFTVNKAVYTDGTHVGTLSQALGAQTRTGRQNAWYDFTYTMSTCSGDAVVTITTDFALTAVTLPGVLTAGTYTTRFQAAVIPGAFTLSGTSASGAVSFDDLSLKELVAPEHRLQVRRAVITCEVADVNFLIDGTQPTTTAGTYQGHLMKVGDVVTLNDIGEIYRFRAINAVASSGAILKVTYSYI